MAIKQRRETVRESHDLGCLRLYREDLRAIAEAVSEVGELEITCTDFKGTTYTTNDVEDIDTLPEDIWGVISASRFEPGKSGAASKIEVRFTAKKASVELVEPDTLTAGVLVRIQQVCSRNRRLLRTIAPSWTYPWFGLFPPLLLAAWGGLSSAVSLKGNHWGPGNTIVTVAFGILVVASLFVGFLTMQPRVVLINAPRATRPTYWQRTRDMWWVGIVTTLIGVIVGYLLPHP
jgi:hypothetical protein